MPSWATVKCGASPWVELAQHLICSQRISYFPAAVPQKQIFITIFAGVQFTKQKENNNLIKRRALP